MSPPFAPVQGELQLSTERGPGAAALYCCKTCRLAVFSLPEDFADGDALGIHRNCWPNCRCSTPNTVAIVPCMAKQAVERSERETNEKPADDGRRLFGAANMPVRRSLILGGSLSAAAVACPVALFQELDVGQRRAERRRLELGHRRAYIQHTPRADPVLLEGRCKQCRTTVCRVFTKKAQGLVYVVEPSAVICVARAAPLS
jgi:hypothetical protein